MTKDEDPCDSALEINGEGETNQQIKLEEGSKEGNIATAAAAALAAAAVKAKVRLQLSHITFFLLSK